MSYDEDEDEDFFLVSHISRALPGQGVAPVKSLTDPALVDFRKRGRKAPLTVPHAKKPSGGSSGGEGGGSGLKRSRTAITAKYGQAVVKVISFGHGRSSVRHQADYISRKGELALEDQDGNLIEGREEVKDTIDEWSDDFSEFINSRDSLHMQISVPKGSDRDAAHDAVRDFAKDVFSENHDYVLVRHDDTEHPHSHILVKTKGHNGRKLNPRKKDLAQWREVYAQRAEERGILLDASSRKSRGQGRKGKKTAAVKAEERGEVAHAVSATAKEVRDNPDSTHEGDKQAKARFTEERKEFAALGVALKDATKRDGEAGERATALLKRVHSHTVNMSEPTSMREDMKEIVKQNPGISESELIEAFKANELARQSGQIKPKGADRTVDGSASPHRDSPGPSR